ncbi:MAG: inositol monophosphatase family protein [Gemmataceae bacterium]
MTSLSLANWLHAAKDAARRGADVLESWRSKFNVREKGRADLVTEADHASQQAVREYLARRFPDHLFVGEEGDALKTRPAADAPPTWICDPLDGTTNYVHDVPAYCVSIGLMVNSELVVGAIYDPRQQEMFSAAKGMGAWLGDKRISVSKIDRLEEALLSTGFAPELTGQERSFDWWRFLAPRTQSLRRTGSTALNLAYVACGRFDGYWAFDNHAWDVAAGFVLVREAGGTVTRADGGPEDCFAADQVATNDRIHSALLSCLRQNPRQSP